jgi:hypothetical protein
MWSAAQQNDNLRESFLLQSQDTREENSKTDGWNRIHMKYKKVLKNSEKINQKIINKSICGE